MIDRLTDDGDGELMTDYVSIEMNNILSIDQGGFRS